MDQTAIGAPRAQQRYDGRPPGWLRIGEIRAIFGLCEAKARDVCAGLPADRHVELEGRGHPVLWDAHAIYEAVLESALSAAGGTGPDRDLLRGAPKDYLERYRQLKGEELELNIAERREQLVRRDEIASALARLAACLKDAAEQMLREGHTRAAQILEEAIDRYERLRGDAKLAN